MQAKTMRSSLLDGSALWALRVGVWLMAALIARQLGTMLARRLSMDGWNGGDVWLVAIFWALSWKVAFEFLLCLLGFAALALRCGPARRLDGSPLSTTALPPGDATCRNVVVLFVRHEEEATLRTTLDRLLQEAPAAFLQDFDFFLLSNSEPHTLCLDGTRPYREQEASLVELYRSRFGIHFEHRIRRRPELGASKYAGFLDWLTDYRTKYRYCLALDADGHVAPQSVLQMVGHMQVHPEIGILQTFPVSQPTGTLYGDLLAFGARSHAALILCGLNVLAAGCSYFWGHNSLILLESMQERLVRPLAEAPRGLRWLVAFLPHRGLEILSHDPAEGSLVVSHNYEVRVTFDQRIESHEMAPAHPLTSLLRDRRWLCGELLNWFVFAWRDRTAMFHRFTFSYGAFTYLASFLLVLWLVLHGGWGLPENSLNSSCDLAALTALLAIQLTTPRVLGLWHVWRRRGDLPRTLATGVLDLLLIVALLPPTVLRHSIDLVRAIGREQEWDRTDRSPVFGLDYVFHWTWPTSALGGLGFLIFQRPTPLLICFLLMLMLAPLTFFVAGLPYESMPASVRRLILRHTHLAEP